MQAVNYFVLFKARAIYKVHIMTHSYMNATNIFFQNMYLLNARDRNQIISIVQFQLPKIQIIFYS